MNTPTPAQLIRIEAEALLRLAARLEDGMSASFSQALELVVECGRRRGRVVVTGIGKSGIIAQKLVATFNSTGTPALFLHPAEALHGDLGMLAKGDLVLALSYSGETEEIVRLVPTLKRMGDALISFCCAMSSTLALASDVVLDVSVEQEACGMGLAPTASTTVMLALGDALAIAASLKKGFRAEDFADLHPGGKLGRKLARVREVMHAGDAIPRVSAATPMPEVIYEMSRKGLGMTTVTEGETLDWHHERRRPAPPAGTERAGGAGDDCRRRHERRAQDGCPRGVCRPRPEHHGRKEDHLAGGRRPRACRGRSSPSS